MPKRITARAGSGSPIASFRGSTELRNDVFEYVVVRSDVSVLLLSRVEFVTCAVARWTSQTEYTTKRGRGSFPCMPADRMDARHRGVVYHAAIQTCRRSRPHRSCPPSRERSTHTARYHTTGTGHLYQGPFKSFPVQDDDHFLTLCRCVQRNALRAKLVRRAEDWAYGSLYRWRHKSDRDPKLLTAWPIRRPRGWFEKVNEPLTSSEFQTLRTSVRRGTPYGSEEWTQKRCERTGLWSTFRPVGRPRKRPKLEPVQLGRRTCTRARNDPLPLFTHGVRGEPLCRAPPPLRW